MQKTLAALLTASLLFAGASQAQDLKGSRASMQRQNQAAVSQGYAFVRSRQEVNGFVETGQLIRVAPNRHFELHQVSYPYALPAVNLFIERLGALYHAECGEKMTVTSLMRPVDQQPANASEDSVHPTGMAVDLRVPSKQHCRNWLERTLLSLEAADVLDVTRERRPPHYHVAIFPETYLQYAQAEPPAVREYVVRKGDSLYLIGRRMGVTVAQLRAANGIRGDLINVGQKLVVPVAGAAFAAADGTAPQAVEALAVTEITHTVQRGDTLWRIARRYGTSVSRLRRENGLADDFLQVGRTLRVVLNPGGL